MWESQTPISETLQKKAQMVFGILAVGCLAIVVLGVITGNGLKDWRGNRRAAEEARQAAMLAELNAIPEEERSPYAGKKSPTFHSSPRPSEPTLREEAPVAPTPSSSEGRNRVHTHGLAEEIRRSLADYFQLSDTYVGFVVRDEVQTSCATATAFVGPDGTQVAVVLVADCEPGSSPSYACIDSSSWSLTWLSAKEYHPALFQAGQCAGATEGGGRDPKPGVW